MKARFFTADIPINYYKSSSIWGGIKEGLFKSSQDTQVIFGRQSSTKIWFDNWFKGGRLTDAMNPTQALEFTRNWSINMFIRDGQWNINSIFQQALPEVAEVMLQMEVSENDEDEVVWRGSTNGNLTTKGAYNFCRERSQPVTWMKSLWQTYIPPKLSMHIWRMARNRLSTAQNLRKRGCNVAPICLGCINGSNELRNHLFWECNNARNIRGWIEDATCIIMSGYQIIMEIVKWVNKLTNKNLFHQLLKVFFFFWFSSTSPTSSGIWMLGDMAGL